MSVIVDSEHVRQFCITVLVKQGIPEGDALTVADSMVTADLRGVHTHGVMKLAACVGRIASGGLNAKPNISVERETEFSCTMDGDNGIGQVVAKKAMDEAISRAALRGIGIVGVHSSNNMGSLGYFSMMPAEIDCIGMVITNASPRLAPWGGITPTLGTNPWSVAVPSPEDRPIVMDTSASVVAANKIRWAAQKGKNIPLGWALDKNGNPTQDPVEALKGIILPVGGHKGYGMAFMIDILAGVLTGAGFGREVMPAVDPDSSQAVGHLMAAVKVSNFIDTATFRERMQSLITMVRSSKLAKGFAQIYLPGEIEHRLEKDRRKKGIPLPESLIQELDEMGTKYDIAFSTS